LAEMESERTRSQSKAYEAFALYDTARLTILDTYKKALVLRSQIIATNSTNRRGGVNNEFRGVVLELYDWLKDKVDYPKRNQQFQVLRRMEIYSLGQKQASSMTWREANFYLNRLRTLIEVLGITKFEQETKDPENLPDELNEL